VNGTERAIPQPLPKLDMGIGGFDGLSRGGLPRNRTSRITRAMRPAAPRRALKSASRR
jgi:hypothetical protein